VERLHASVSRFPPLFRVRLRSVRSKPLTGSVKTMVTELTDDVRGLGVTGVIAAVRRLLSMI
jgi:hypothetical protein